MPEPIDMETTARLIAERQARLRQGRAAPVPGPDGESLAVLNLAMERAMAIDGASMANIQTVDAESGGLRIAAHTGFPSEFLEFFELVEHTSNASCASAFANGRAVFVPRTERSPIFVGSTALEVMLDAGSHAVGSVPVTSPNGDVIAMLNTHHRRPAFWTDRQKAALERLARTTGRVLHQLHVTS